MGVHGIGNLAFQLRKMLPCHAVCLTVLAAMGAIHLLIDVVASEAEEASLQAVGVHQRAEEYLKLRHTARLLRLSVNKHALTRVHSVDDGVPTLLRRHPSVAVAEQCYEERS